MRSGAAAGHLGYFHQAAFYAADDEFLAIVIPFLAEGVEAGEPVVVASIPAHRELIERALPAKAGAKVTYIGNDQQYARPAAAIREYRRMLTSYVKQGARQIRVTGDVPHPGVGVPWDWWGRYEAAANTAFEEFPLWGLCPYDTRTAPGEVLDQVRRTHPHIATPQGDLANPEYSTREVKPRAAWSDPIEATAPAVVLVDPMPTTARAAIAVLGRRTRLSNEDLSGLMLAVTEVLTNGVRHGRAPTRFRLWCAPDRIVATVTDQGAGPADPLIGLMPVTPAAFGLGGQGLWLAHQMCSYLNWQLDAMGFTVRMLAGRFPAPLS
jgi:anti-sigma regulatory factor (Ser/Thr protein kinase)